MFGLFADFVEFVITAVEPQSAGGEFAGRLHQIQQRDIMAYNQHGRPGIGNEVVQLPPARGVEMIGRFVEQDDRRTVDRNSGQKEFRFLAAAQRIDRSRQIHIGQSPRTERSPAAGFNLPVIGQNIIMHTVAAAVADGVQGFQFCVHTQRPAHGDTPDTDLLRNVPGRRSTMDTARRGAELPGDQFQERGFPGSVIPDNGNLRARGHGQADILE